MNIEKEPAAMQDGLQLQTLIFALEKLETEAFDSGESEYREGLAALAGILDNRQAARLEELERLNRENLAYGLRFSAVQGICAGARECALETAFQELVVERLLKSPVMREHPAFHARNRRILALEKDLCSGIPMAYHSHVTSVTVAWDDRIFSALRHGFSLGCCFSWAAGLRETPQLEDTVQLLEQTLGTPTGVLPVAGRGLGGTKGSPSSFAGGERSN